MTWGKNYKRLCDLCGKFVMADKIQRVHGVYMCKNRVVCEVRRLHTSTKRRKKESREVKVIREDLEKREQNGLCELPSRNVQNRTK